MRDALEHEVGCAVADAIDAVLTAIGPQVDRFAAVVASEEARVAPLNERFEGARRGLALLARELAG
jgi:hypothetical protein